MCGSVCFARALDSCHSSFCIATSIDSTLYSGCEHFLLLFGGVSLLLAVDEQLVITLLDQDKLFWDTFCISARDFVRCSLLWP